MIKKVTLSILSAIVLMGCTNKMVMNSNTLFRLETKNETKIISAYSPIVIRTQIIENQPLSNTWLVHLFHDRLDTIPFKSITAKDFMAIYEPWVEESIPEPSYE